MLNVYIDCRLSKYLIANWSNFNSRGNKKSRIYDKKLATFNSRDIFLPATISDNKVYIECTCRFVEELFYILEELFKTCYHDGILNRLKYASS